MTAGTVYIIKPQYCNVYQIGQSIAFETRMKRLVKRFAPLNVECTYTAHVADCHKTQQFLVMSNRIYHLGRGWFALTPAALDRVIRYLCDKRVNERTV